jgi:flagellar assembly factor FliW
MKSIDTNDTKAGSDQVILTFVEDILGFENIKSYKLLPAGDDSPFFFLRAVRFNYPCFAVCDPFYFIPDYKLVYDKDILDELGAGSPDDLKCVVIATIPDEFENITVNLKSPVIFNMKNNSAKQFVLDTLDYSVRHRLFGNKAVK